jgi:hypothetical protein
LVVVAFSVAIFVIIIGVFFIVIDVFVIVVSVIVILRMDVDFKFQLLIAAKAAVLAVKMMSSASRTAATDRSSTAPA